MLIVFPACFGDKRREYHQFLTLPFFSYKRFYFCFFLRAQPSSLKSGSSPFSLLLFFLLLSLLKNCFQSSCFFGPRSSVYPRSARLSFLSFAALGEADLAVFSLVEADFRELLFLRPPLSLFPLFSPATSTTTLRPFRLTSPPLQRKRSFASGLFFR